MNRNKGNTMIAQGNSNENNVKSLRMCNVCITHTHTHTHTHK